MQHLDSTIGSKVLGPDQTISSKVQSTATAATQQAKSMDEQRGISKTANDVSSSPANLIHPYSLNRPQYYTKAITSPFGQKVLAFYTTTSKQVFDIHEEARRIADTHKSSQTFSSDPTSENVSTAEPEKTA